MSQEAERLKQSPGGNGQGAPGLDPSQRVRQAPDSIGVPAVAPARKMYAAAVTVPEIKTLGRDRHSRRVAAEQQQKLGQIVFEATKIGLAMRSVQAVTACAVNTMDQIQEDVMDIYYQRDRDPGMNELMNRVSVHHLQQTEVKIGVLTDLHFQRLTELL
jgi:hypothetical protein